VREVYRMGGAQAVAALAYGVDGVPRVDKIVGPGNLFVALAKQHVFGEVDIDSIAGPSEVIVIADDSTRADFAAADLLAQAEHSPGSAVLITWHRPLVDAIERELERQLASLTRNELTRAALAEFGALIVVADRTEAAQLANHLATEHLHIACREPQELLSHIRSAGAVFMGPYSPVAVGDYVAGPSHVLPTGATARFASGLSSNDFLRTNSVIDFTAADLHQVAADAVAMAHVEGLTAHAASVEIRQQSDSSN
jgi:histidinol dehydrogenase